MKVLKNTEGKKVVVDVLLNTKKVSEFKIHTNPMVQPSKVAKCFNSPTNCTDELTKDLVCHIKKTLSFQVVNELLWQRNKIKQVLSDAFEIAPTAAIEDEIISLQFHVLPLVDRIYVPVSNTLSKRDLKNFAPYKTYDEALSVIFGSTFLTTGIMTFNARVEN